MGLNIQGLKALLHENAYKEISGKVLLIGKSTVEIKYETISAIASLFGLDVKRGDFRKRDTQTKKSSTEFWVDDVELLHTLFPHITSIDVLDVSPYEGANVIADMNLPISRNLYSSFDFVYDSSVLDNVFNPAQMISNIATMLRANGRVCMNNVASFFPGALCSCHPEWFYSFFAVNNFSDAKVYLTIQRKPSPRFETSTDLWRYSPEFTPNVSYDHFGAVKSIEGIASTLVIAELGSSPCDSVVFPTNLQYISSSGAQDWSRMEARYAASTRPLMRARSAVAPPPPHLTDHFEFLGTDF